MVDTINPDAKKYFMVPTRSNSRSGTNGTGKTRCASLHGRSPERPATGFRRRSTHPDPSYSPAWQFITNRRWRIYRSRFGAPPEEMPPLLQAIGDSGAEPALAFNVGSLVTDPEAYRHAISVAKSVLEQLPFRLRLIDIGGGYPRSYPGLHSAAYGRILSEL